MLKPEWTGHNSQKLQVTTALGLSDIGMAYQSRTKRIRSLGNAFQTDTMGYHLSVLKHLFLGEINLLSLFFKKQAYSQKLVEKNTTER